MNSVLANQLLALERRDRETRTRLAADGSLFEGYAPEMEQVHLANAAALASILDRHGWPGRSLVGEDGCRAAWLVAQHAISLPPFQRRCLALLQDAVSRGEAPAMQAAYLEDRIAFNQGRPQTFGTCLDWQHHGTLGPGPLVDPDRVDHRRRLVGLPPLAQSLRRARAEAEGAGERPPPDRVSRLRAMGAWARKVGWR